MSILRILADARTKPQMFPEKEGRVVYSDHFKTKALSKDEILAWQNANDGGLEETRLTGDEFDAMIGLSGLVAIINQFHEGTENIKNSYYCLTLDTFLNGDQISVKLTEEQRKWLKETYPNCIIGEGNEEPNITFEEINNRLEKDPECKGMAEGLVISGGIEISINKNAPKLD